MGKNRLAELILDDPEMQKRINDVNNKDELMMFASKYIENYSEEEAKRDLNDILGMVELEDDTVSTVSGGVNKEPVYMPRISNNEFFKKLLGILSSFIS